MESKILPQCQFPTTTRVCPKYSVHDCLWKQLRTSNSLHTPSNLRFEFFWYFTKSSFHHKRSETRLLVINMVYTSCRTTSHFGSYEIRKESQSSPEIKILLILAKNCWEIETKFPRIVCFTPKLECSLNILPMTVANPIPTDWSQLDSACARKWTTTSEEVTAQSHQIIHWPWTLLRRLARPTMDATRKQSAPNFPKNEYGYTQIQRARNSRLSEKLACFAFL